MSSMPPPPARMGLTWAAPETLAAPRRLWASKTRAAIVGSVDLFSAKTSGFLLVLASETR